MAAVFDPDKYLNSDEWKIAVDRASSHYEKLGLRFGDSLSNEQINEAFHKRYEWWNEKDKISRRGGQAHPTIKIVGPFISEAMKNLIEAKSILSDTTKTSQYDNNLREEINKKDEEGLIRYIRFALQGDNQISQEEKRNLLNMADTLKINRDKGEEIIIAEMKKVGATFKSESDSVDSASSSMPFDVLLNKSYYELLGLSEDADYSQIKEVYDREYQKYNTVRDKKRAEPKWVVVSEAWECLRDPDKKRKYDEAQRRKREKGLTREGDPKLEIVDESGKEKTRFEFKDMKLGATSSVTVVAKNGGGGTLDAKIVTSCPWLIVDTDRIHQSKLPQDITITVDPKKHKKMNCLGGHDEGFIEIAYPEVSQPEKIHVEFSIEIETKALNNFRTNLTTCGLFFGGLFGYLIYNMNFIQGMNENIAGIAGILAIIGAVIVAGCLGYRDKEAGVAFGSGCGTLIGLIILYLILVSYFPHVLSVCSWTLAYGSLGYMLSSPIRRALWEKNLVLPITIGVLTLALTGGIVLAGFVSAKPEGKGPIRSSQRKARSATVKGRLFVETEPVDAMIKILNIPPKFYQGMELDPGRYHVEVSANGYKTEKTWIELGGGEDGRINISLVKTGVVDAETTEPNLTVPAEVRPIVILDRVVHLGDYNVKQFSEPKPQGVVFESSFILEEDRAPLGGTYQLVVYASHLVPNMHPEFRAGYYHSSAYLNDQKVGILNEQVMGIKDSLEVVRIVLPIKQGLLKKGRNNIRVLAGKKTGNYDDFEIHKIIIVAIRVAPKKETVSTKTVEKRPAQKLNLYQTSPSEEKRSDADDSVRSLPPPPTY